METASNKYCSICKEILKTGHISYSCNHSFCLKCYPYILFSLLKSSGINKEFLANPQTEFSCMICRIGKTQFHDNLFEEFLKEKANKKLCEACGMNPAEGFCTNCNLRCLEQIHKPLKFQTHKITNLEESEITRVEFQCSCPAKHYLTNFCLTCQTAICSYCLKSEHEKHQQIPLEKVIREVPQNNNNEDIKTKMHDLIQNYSGFMDGFLDKVNSARMIYNEKFNKFIEEIINELMLLKTCNEEKSTNEFQLLRSQFQLVQASMVFMKEELDKKGSILSRGIKGWLSFTLTSSDD